MTRIKRCGIEESKKGRMCSNNRLCRLKEKGRDIFNIFRLFMCTSGSKRKHVTFHPNRRPELKTKASV